MARSRRAELREEKGVEERLEREKAREQRRIERANREARRKEAAMCVFFLCLFMMVLTAV